MRPLRGGRLKLHSFPASQLPAPSGMTPPVTSLMYDEPAVLPDMIEKLEHERLLVRGARPGVEDKAGLLHVGIPDQIQEAPRLDPPAQGSGNLFEMGKPDGVLRVGRKPDLSRPASGLEALSQKWHLPGDDGVAAMLGEKCREATPADRLDEPDCPDIEVE